MDHTILLVDDLRMFIEIEKEFLQYTLVDVLTAKDGLEALDVIKTKRPDVVFMDLEMPRMDGATCCRAIKADTALTNIPVVILTSKGKDENRERCYSAGCDYFLTKPLDRDVFLDVARKFIPDIDRRERRILVSMDTLLRVSDDNVPCRLHDLSVGGAFITTDYFGIPNSVVQISFTLPDGTAIECHARIAWINRIYAKFPRGIGIKFALMPQRMQEALKQFIDTHK
jgi:CheY-like chemotaxis protein